jgi:hypothetical protein
VTYACLALLFEGVGDEIFGCISEGLGEGEGAVILAIVAES